MMGEHKFETVIVIVNTRHRVTWLSSYKGEIQISFEDLNIFQISHNWPEYLYIGCYLDNVYNGQKCSQSSLLPLTSPAVC